MAKTYRPYDPDQSFLLAPNPADWLPEDHAAFFFRDLVAELDLSEILASYEEEERGGPPFHPQMMTAVFLYAYSVGVRSGRKIESHLLEDVAFRVISGNQQPDFRTIDKFRKRHLKALENLFEQSLEAARKAGLVKEEHIALDGTKIRANASRHKSMSYDRMEKKEKEIKDAIKRFVEETFEEAERINAEEDLLYGDDNPYLNRMPPELRTKAGRLKKIREAMKDIEREAREKAQKEGQDPSAAKPEKKAQRNFTDPESRIMPDSEDKKRFIQAYNAQAAVDAESQVIVAWEVTNRPTDVGHFESMVDQVIENLGGPPEELSADPGYYSEANVKMAQSRGMTALIPPDRQKHGEKPPPAPRGRIPADLPLIDRMRRRLKTKRGRERYALRKEVVEPVFGQLKEVEGLRRMSMRGLKSAQGEFGFACAVHNFLKVFRAGRHAPG